MSEHTQSNNNKHRYLVITELFLPTKGGTAVWFDEVYQRIGAKEIHIVTKAVDGDKEYDKTHKNTVHRVPLNRHWWLRPESLGMYLRLFFVMLKVALSNKFDAVHAGRVLPEGLVGLIVAKIIRKPLVIYAHGEEITTWRQSAKFKVMKFTYRHADKIIANSEFTRKELEKIGIKNDKIFIISPGVDIHRFKTIPNVEDLRQSLGISKEQKLILSVGRLSRRKGFDMLIKAIKELRDQGINVYYVVIGIGEDQAYLENLSRDEKVDKYVHLIGHVSIEDLPRWYNACDVFAMPNREINGDTEGFGMVFIEAAACGKPVVAGKAGGTGSAVLDGLTGVRVDGNNLLDVVLGLKKLLLDNDFYLNASKEAYFRAHKIFSWKSVAQRTKELATNEKLQK